MYLRTGLFRGPLIPVQALTGGPWIQARNFAVMTGVNAGISCAMKRIRKIQHDDLQTRLVRASVANLGAQAALGT